MKSRELLVIVLVLFFVFSFNLALAEKIKINTDIMVSEKINHYDGKQVGVYSFVKVGYIIDSGELIEIEKKVTCYYKKEKSLGLPPKGVYSNKGIEIMEKGCGEYVEKEESTSSFFKYFFLLMKKTDICQKKYVYENESWQDPVVVSQESKTTVNGAFLLCQIIFFLLLIFDRFFCYSNKESVKYVNWSCACHVFAFFFSCLLWNFLFLFLPITESGLVNIFLFVLWLGVFVLFVLFLTQIYLQFLINCKAGNFLETVRLLRIVSIISLVLLGIFSYGLFNPILFILASYLLASFLVLIAMRFRIFYDSIANKKEALILDKEEENDSE